MEKLIAKSRTDFRYCVIIPTYNNAKTVKKVIDGVLLNTQDIIVVNDGSTDQTPQILQSYPHLSQIHLPNNKGKGNALRVGFKKAIEMGFQYAITIDSDGQHFPDDISGFLEALQGETTKNVLLIGARNMEQEGVPRKSSFGNNFSNFWFYVETGVSLKDTQSGFRLYPLFAIENLRLITHKFEFEIEVIVKSSWNGTLVKNIPVKVLYDENERVSHFRPFKDFTRISILNTWLVLVAFFYIKPRNILRKMKQKGLSRFMKEDFLASKDSPQKKASSIALGVFIGLSPFWGFHTVIVIFLALFLKLNKTVAFVFSNISLPPFIPFVLYASSKMGQWVLGEHSSDSMQELYENFEIVKHLKIYIVGSFSLAFSASVILGFLGYFILAFFEKRQAPFKV